MSTRHLTNEEIEFALKKIQKNVPELKKIKEREEKILKLRNYLEEKKIGVNVFTDILNIILDQKGNINDKIKLIYKIISKRKPLFPETVKEIIEFVNRRLNATKRLEYALFYILENKIFQYAEQEIISEKLVLQNFDYFEIIPDFLVKHKSKENIEFYNEVKNIYELNKKNPDDLVESLYNYTDELRLKKSKFLKDLEEVLKGEGEIANKKRIRLLLELDFVQNNKNVSMILKQEIPNNDLKYDRFVDLVSRKQELDIPELLVKLFQGNDPAFQKFKNDYIELKTLLYKPLVEKEEEKAKKEIKRRNNDKWDNETINKVIIELFENMKKFAETDKNYSMTVEKSESEESKIQFTKDVKTNFSFLPEKEMEQNLYIINYFMNNKKEIVGIMDDYPFIIDEDQQKQNLSRNKEIYDILKLLFKFKSELSSIIKSMKFFLKGSDPMGKIEKEEQLEGFDEISVLNILQIITNESIEIDYRMQALKAYLKDKEINEDFDEFLDDYIKNYPRLLTNEEINRILGGIILVRGDREIAKIVRNSVALTMKKHLKNIRLTPKAIEEFRERFIKNYAKAQQIYGQAVGVQAATAMGEMVTQMTLNSFHKAGSSLNVTSGIDRTTELINVKKDPKSASNIIYYKHKYELEGYSDGTIAKELVGEKPSDDILNKINYTFDEMLDKKNEIVGITVQDIIIDTITDVTDTILRDEPHWYEYYKAVYGFEKPESSFMLRIRLNPLKMYQYKILIEDIVNVITTGTWMDQKVCQSDHCIKVIYSPDGDGIEDPSLIHKNKEGKNIKIPIIDIFPIEGELEVEKTMNGIQNKKLISLNFLRRIVVPSLKNIYIQGVEKIINAEVGKLKIWDAVDYYVKDEENDRRWTIYVKENIKQDIGIFNIHIARLCWAVGIKVIDISITDDENDLIRLKVEIPEQLNNDPGKVVKKAVTDDSSAASKYQEKHKKETPSRRPETAISRAAYYYNVMTVGGNLKEVMTVPDVDTDYTYSNNPSENYEMFGIEVGRKSLLNELLKVFMDEGNLSINIRHVTLLVDFMTTHGELVSLTFKGMNRQNVGFFTGATSEHASERLIKAALNQEIEKFGSVSLAIATGVVAKYHGTGAVNIKVDRSKLDKTIFNAINEDYNANNFLEAIKGVKEKEEFITFENNSLTSKDENDYE